MHYALDVYETYGYNLDLALRTFDTYWAQPSLLGEKIDFWHRSTTWEGLEKRGHEMIRAYHELAVWKNVSEDVLGTEVHFIVPLGRHELEGTIDRLVANRGKKTISAYDFKTGAAVPEKLRFNLQFTAYAYATTRPEFWQYVPGWEDGYERFRSWSRDGWWYHARRARFYNAGKRTEADYRRLILAADEMENAIEAGVFPLDVKGENCYYCPFSDGTCGREVELSGMAAGKENE